MPGVKVHPLFSIIQTLDDFDTLLVYVKTLIDFFLLLGLKKNILLPDFRKKKMIMHPSEKKLYRVIRQSNTSQSDLLIFPIF